MPVAFVVLKLELQNEGSVQLLPPNALVVTLVIGLPCTNGKTAIIRSIVSFITSTPPRKIVRSTLAI